MNRKYELVVVLDPEQSSEEQENLTSKIKKLIASIGGKVENTREWGKKELSYLIKKKNFGYFFLFNFSAPTDKLSSLKQNLQNEENILRFLFVVTNKGGK